jgi:hypothetical protein
MLLAYEAILCSPHFLYFKEEPGKLSDHALASRLSYFLWSSHPDQPLLDLAAKGKLSEPSILREQTERLLKDPKSKAFTENFVGQWLGLRQIEFTFPDERLYPEFDERLQHSMPKETTLFFDEMRFKSIEVTHQLVRDVKAKNEDEVVAHLVKVVDLSHTFSGFHFIQCEFLRRVRHIHTAEH